MGSSDESKPARERIADLRREKQAAEARRVKEKSSASDRSRVRDLDERIDNLESEIERLELAVEMERQSDA